MSLSQTSDQRPVSTDNQIDRTNTTTNQETSFGESLASLLDDPNIISIHNVSNNDDAFNCIGAEDVVQTHLNYEQDPFTRIEALYNQLTYSLGQASYGKEYDYHERHYSVSSSSTLPPLAPSATTATVSAPPRSTSLSTVATSISLAASLIPNSTNSQEKKLAQMLPPLMSDCQFTQSQLHEIELYQLGSEKANFLNPLLVNKAVTPYFKDTHNDVSSKTADNQATCTGLENFCSKFCYPTNFATIASSPLFAKNFVLNSNSETLTDKRQNALKGEIYDDDTVHLQLLPSNNGFPYYLRSNSSKLDELRESLNIPPSYVLPSSQLVHEYNDENEEDGNHHYDSVISNSSISYAAIAPLRRNDTDETPTPLRYHNQANTIPSSPIIKIGRSQQASTMSQMRSSTSDASTDTPPFAHVPKHNVHNMVFPIIFTFFERKQDFMSYVQQFIEKESVTVQPPPSTRPTSYVKRAPRCHSPKSSEIYDIGPKILPVPFSKDYIDLKNTRFKPLSELKQMAHYQLPPNESCNYVVDKTKKKGNHCPNRPASADLGAFRLQPPPLNTLGEAKNDRYYSRLNIYELSKILELDQFSIDLTKFIEGVILEIFGNYCDFKLGLQTWIRDTDKEKRKSLIQQLYSYTSIFYPELDQFKLEVIIRRGSYSMMQTRLRRERRLQRGKK